MIVVTGASGGIGRGLVSELAENDRVVGLYHTRSPKDDDPRVRFYQVDVRDPASIARFVDATKAELSRVTLVNLAGVSIDRLAVRVPPAEWDEVVNVNLRGSFLMSQALLEIMMRERWGRIVNFSSVVARSPVVGTTAYGAAKAGVEGMTRTLAAECGPFNVTVNCLSLGYFSAGLIETVPEAKRKALLEKIPLRRWGEVTEIARTIRYLIECAYVTGAVIDLDGGLRG